MGRKGEVHLEEYEKIAEALSGDEESFCKIEFTALEYDTSNGSSVYSSLKNGKQLYFGNRALLSKTNDVVS